MAVSHQLHAGDLPEGVRFSGSIAVDTEAMGLRNHRDRLCVVQLCGADGQAHVVHFPTPHYHAPNLVRLLEDPKILKIFHFARFDVAIIRKYLGAAVAPVYCTKIASRLCRTYSDRHGLKDICKELLGVDLSKQQQSSDWGAPSLTREQVEYAASDVVHLHALREKLEERLARENRTDLARRVMECVSVRAELDLLGWSEEDIFAH